MDELAEMRIFVQVVESGSFSAAARNANVSVSSIVRPINSLESSVGVRLLNRTTRQQSLTEAGQLFYTHARKIIHDINSIRRDVSSYQETIKGVLRVSLRTSAGNEIIVPALPRFLERHGGIVLDVALTDDRVDMVARGIDVSVWQGDREDSSIVARRLTTSRRVVCGSPAYFARAGEPVAPADLAGHNCIVFNANQYDNVWRFARDGVTADLRVSGNLKTANGSILMSAALSGLGLVAIPEWMARAALRDGRLRGVLDDYDVSLIDHDTALYAAYPNSRGLTMKARAFVDFLVALFEVPRAG